MEIIRGTLLVKQNKRDVNTSRKVNKTKTNKQRDTEHTEIAYGPKDTGFTAHSIRGHIPSWLSTRDISCAGNMACWISA